MGFHWESYRYHKQQTDNYKANRGRYSDRTFKSIIDAKLVPTVCASCGFSCSRWAALSDARLFLRIERVLRPSESTDFVMELKEIRLENYENEPLEASYITFAEKFLAKVAEASDAGRPVMPAVIRAAYKAALDKDSHPGFRPGGNRRRANTTGKNARKRQINASHVRQSNASASFGGGSKRNSGTGKLGHHLQAEKMRTWRGCDSRIDSWHTERDLFECFKKPCQ
jgi:hypothetical protein